jgi:hypothetical protein
MSQRYSPRQESGSRARIQPIEDLPEARCHKGSPDEEGLATCGAKSSDGEHNGVGQIGQWLAECKGMRGAC